MASAAELEAALADPLISTVLVTASPLLLAGRHLSVSGAGRSVTVRGACGAAACVLDARWLSRHFRVHAGADLVLEGLSLLSGASRLGGCVSVEAGSALIATRCTFANSVSASSGGCIAVAAATATVTGSEFTNCTATYGDGGAIGGVLGATLALSDSQISGCRATSGGGIALRYYSSGVASAVTVSNCQARFGGGLRLDRSTLTVSNSLLTVRVLNAHNRY